MGCWNRAQSFLSVVGDQGSLRDLAVRLQTCGIVIERVGSPGLAVGAEVFLGQREGQLGRRKCAYWVSRVI